MPLPNLAAALTPFIVADIQEEQDD
jgi:hypothetical protein